MAGISTTQHVSGGTWEAGYSRDPHTGEAVYSVCLVADHLNAAQINGLTAADVDELIHELRAARQDADNAADLRARLGGVTPRDCDGGTEGLPVAGVHF